METCDKHPSARAVWMFQRVWYNPESQKVQRLQLTFCNHCFLVKHDSLVEQRFLPVEQLVR
jgi:hypothetical protein